MILVAARSSDDSVVARTLTAPSGTYRLTLPAAEVRLRALRVGHRPTELGTVRLGSDERRTLDFRLEPAPIVLAEVRETVRDRCRLPSDAGAQVVALYDEVQKALTAAFLSRGTRNSTVEYELIRRYLDPRGVPLGAPTRRSARGSSARPFQSISADSLAVVGYVSESADMVTYRAPDADVLLSASFAASHCLQLAAAHPERAEWVGLAFRPSGSGVAPIDIAGVLWIDRPSAQLRRLEYRYVGFEPGSLLDRSAIGGSVDFTVLEDGWWFEDAWEIRMPRLSRRVGGSEALRGGGGLTLDAIETFGGRVLSLASGSVVRYVGGTAVEPAAEVPSADQAPPEPAVCLATDADAEPKATLFGTVFERAPEPSAGAIVRVSWREQFSVNPGHDWRWVDRELASTTADDGLYSVCGVPRDRLLRVRGTREARATPTIGARVPWTADRLRVDLRFGEPLAAGSARRGTAVRVVTGDGAPVPYAVVSVGAGSGRVADELGVAWVQLTSGSRVRLFVRRVGFAPVDTTVDASALLGDFRIHLTPLGQQLDAITVTATADSPLGRSGFYERVLRAQRGAITAEFITPEEIDARKESRLSRLLAGRRTIAVTVGLTPPRAIIVGRGGCDMSVLLDGQRIRSDSPRASEGPVAIDDLVSGREVVAVEIYPSAANAPAELMPLTGGGSCGIIAIWTGAP